MAVKGLHLNGNRVAGTGSMSGNQSTLNPKKDLASWWNGFKNRKAAKNEEDSKTPLPVKSAIFGVPLQESIRYANVAISLPDEHGANQVYGYVPIIVAKCGVFLKEKALDTEGIFRQNGSEKRIRELKAIFDTADRYGKGLDWAGFTVHDAANVLRRYLRDLPEPIIPLDFYERFRDPLREIEARSAREGEGMPLEICREDEEAAIKIYQKLITQLPSLNRQLLLYLLDLLAVFAAKSDVNLMNAANLAAIFQPGMLSHRVHDMAPKEYRLSQDVVIFLIDTQDNFLIGMDGTASEEMSKADMTATSSTARDQVISGPQASDNQTTPLAFNMAPAAADVKRFGGLRRNASAASKTSSAGPSVPGSPAPNSRPTSTFGAGGVHRSNTAPSRRPATIGTSKYRFSRSPEPASPRSFRESSPKSVAETSPSTDLTPQQSQPSVAALASEMRPQTNDTHQPVQHESDPTNGRPQEAGTIPQPQSSPIVSQNVQPQSPKLPSIAPVAPSTSMRSIDQESMHLNLPPPPTHIFGISPAKGTSTPPGEKRSLSAFFSKSPTSDAERSERRETNKLRKRKKESRENGAAQASAQSSTSTVHLDTERPPEEGRLE